MVIAVMRRPPDRALLGGGLRQERQTELPEPVELVGAMAEIPVVAARDAEHAKKVGPGTETDQRPGRPERGQNRKEDQRMHDDERKHGCEVVILALECNFGHQRILEEWVTSGGDDLRAVRWGKTPASLPLPPAFSK